MPPVRRIPIGKFLGAALPEDERREMLEDLFVLGKANQGPFLNRMAILLVLSTVIACCGLLSDSAAVVIGAMLVAPIMRPVMTTAAAIILGWPKYFHESLLLIACMALGAVAISAAFAWISPELVDMPEQVLARTRPTFFDLVIALAAGCGGAFTLTRKEASAIPGVAMAVALLPPLASCGILLTFSEAMLAFKAFVLFITNFAAMALAGALMFKAVGISPKEQREKRSSYTRKYLALLVLLVVGVSVPLYYFSHEVWYDASYEANQSDELQAWLKENQLHIDDVRIDYDRRILFLRLLGPTPPVTIETLHAEIEKAHRAEHGESEPFSIEVLWTQAANYSWPPERAKLKDQRQLKQDYYGQIAGLNWKWIGTQYADGDWLRPPATEGYSFRPTGENTLEVVTSCDKGTGSFELSQEEIAIELDLLVGDECPSFKTDTRFIADLNQAINISLDEDALSFRLSNDDGVMYFEKIGDQGM